MTCVNINFKKLSSAGGLKTMQRLRCLCSIRE